MKQQCYLSGGRDWDPYPRSLVHSSGLINLISHALIIFSLQIFFLFIFSPESFYLWPWKLLLYHSYMHWLRPMAQPASLHSEKIWSYVHHLAVSIVSSHGFLFCFLARISACEDLQVARQWNDKLKDTVLIKNHSQLTLVDLGNLWAYWPSSTDR